MASTGAAENIKIGTVCVTGAAGFCASWLVMRLLERGYKVRATLRDPENSAKTSHLRALPLAKERLEIVKADMLSEEDFVEALRDCEGAFLVATPIIFQTDDPERDMIRPAVEGTINILKACKKSPSMRRIVYTSSMAAVGQRPPNEIPSNYTFDESSWSSVDYLKTLESDPSWMSSYSISKTLAEQAAFDFAEKNGLDLVSIAPSLVVGAFLTPEFPNSVRTALAVVTGESRHFPYMRRNSFVDVDDLARAHVFLYENASSRGRYICSAIDASIDEVAQMLKLRYPELPVVTEFGSLEGPNYSFSSKRLTSLGFQFNHDLKDIYDHAIECCEKRGYI